MTDQERWDNAEQNAIRLEKVDTWFYGVPVERLREIRKMPFGCYCSLSELEKHYWIRTMGQRGENVDKLRLSIERLEQQEIQQRLIKRIDNLVSESNLLAAALKKRLQKQIKKVIDNTPDPNSMTTLESAWLSLRITAKKERTNKPDLYPTQRELASAMGMNPMAVHRIEKKMEARTDIKQFFAVLGIAARKPRGATVTKRTKD